MTWRYPKLTLNTHGLGGNHLDNSGISALYKLGVVLDGFTGTTINLLENLGELARNVGGMAIEDWGVAGTNLTRVVEDNDLCIERLGRFGRIILGVPCDITSSDFLDGDVLDVEADVVTGKTLDKLDVVHLDRLDFGGDVGRSEGDDHASLDDTTLNTTNRHRANTRNLVHILKRKTERLIGGTCRRLDSINSLEKGLARVFDLGLLLPAFVPWAVGGLVDHVVAVEARDGDKRHGLGVVANLLDEVGGLLDDFLESLLGPFGGVHFVDGDDELSNTQGEGKKCMLSSLAILGDTSLEFTSTGSNDENGAISLGGSSDHVLDKVTMTRSICGKLAAVTVVENGILPMTVT
jgi:hypothetical protein